MSSNDRQNRLLVAEDWKRIYQTYQKADFQSYDFESLRRVMISYIRENYPEDFNDYISSSEYIALIDLIAYFGQNLSFRVDLNARENFIELAERRESILRLARLLSYNPKRNIAAKGLLKITSVKTTESTFDSNNTSLQNQNIVWNDPSNPNWYEHFIKVLNNAFSSNKKFGTPVKKAVVNGISTEKYELSSINTDVPVYSFSKTIDGSNATFEIVAADIDEEIVEEVPTEGGLFSIVYREDGLGPASNNTGFFAYFKQGVLDYGDFTITNPSQNQIVTIDAININNDDVWLFEIGEDGSPIEQWTKIDAIEGNNIIYNDVIKNNRKVYSVLSKINDRISLIFADGTFGDLPRGNFRIYYRSSRNQNLVITPRDMLGISIDIEYQSVSNKIEVLSMIFELQYTVANASTAESNESIRKLAPMNYYTQNRLITAEDYQIGPLLASTNIVKTKSVNRISSGISRYFDLIDSTGKYSTTNLFGTDGVLYKEKYKDYINFSFSNLNDIENWVLNTIEPLLKSSKIKNFFYQNITPIPYVDQGLKWISITEAQNLNTGYLENANGIKQVVGTATTSILQYIKTNTLIRFEAPPGYHFDKKRKIVAGEASSVGDVTYFWTKVVKVSNDGTEITENDEGPIVFNDIIPTGALLSVIRPFLSKNLEDSVRSDIIDKIAAYKTFGLRYDRIADRWSIVEYENLNLVADFSIGKTGDVTEQKLDSSWLLVFEYKQEQYEVQYRAARFIFESPKEVAFYFDESDKIFDVVTGRIIRDKITVLSSNLKPNSIYPFTVDYDWAITNNYRDELGYITNKKIEIDFFDSDDDGVPDDENLFEEIVNENLLQPPYTLIFQKKTLSINGVEIFQYIDNDIENILILQSVVNLGPLSQYVDKQIIYFIRENIFKIYQKATSKFILTNDYKAYVGRDKIKFKYLHAADNQHRIDPSVSNIIDTYILTKDYDTEFRNYLNGVTDTKPLPMSSDALSLNFSSSINKIKSVTDEIVYHPAKYKILFGATADSYLQATFKLIKNSSISLNDNQIKSDVVFYINQFFSLENWDFGETFYMSELETYVIDKMAPNIVSLVLVSKDASQSFGSLYEIRCEDDEIFINGATVANIEIVEELNATKLRSNGVVVNSTIVTTGIQSKSL